MTDEEIEELAHRMAWRYRKSSDPHHSDTYTFNEATVHQFARKLIAMEREACAKVCDHEDEGGANDGDAQWSKCGEFCAAAIRARSNG